MTNSQETANPKNKKNDKRVSQGKKTGNVGASLLSTYLYNRKPSKKTNHPGLPPTPPAYDSNTREKGFPSTHSKQSKRTTTATNTDTRGFQSHRTSITKHHHHHHTSNSREKTGFHVSTHTCVRQHRCRPRSGLPTWSRSTSWGWFRR